jgi:hypothetical protein
MCGRSGRLLQVQPEQYPMTALGWLEPIMGSQERCHGGQPGAAAPQGGLEPKVAGAAMKKERPLSLGVQTFALPKTASFDVINWLGTRYARCSLHNP